MAHRTAVVVNMQLAAPRHPAQRESLLSINGLSMLEGRDGCPAAVDHRRRVLAVNAGSNSDPLSLTTSRGLATARGVR